MALTEELTALRKRTQSQLQGRLSDASWDELARVQSDVEARLRARSPRVGDLLPELEFQDPAGRTRSLSQLVAQGPLVLSFFRGSWCPFCRLEAAALDRMTHAIQQLGASVVGITPEALPFCNGADARCGGKQVGIQYLRDVGNRAAAQLGLIFPVTERLQPLYAELGVDLGPLSDDGAWELPVPATFVVDTSSSVRFAFVEADFTRRVEPSEVLRALRALRSAA